MYFSRQRRLPHLRLVHGIWTCPMYFKIRHTPSVPTQSRAAASQEMPPTSFRFADKKELYVKSFAKTSARKGHFDCQPLLFFLKDLLDPRLIARLQLTTCGAVFTFSHPSRMPKLSQSRTVSEGEFWSWAPHHQRCIEDLAVSATTTICSSSRVKKNCRLPHVLFFCNTPKVDVIHTEIQV